MNTQKTIEHRISELCVERGIAPHALARIFAIPPSTIKNILNGKSQNLGAVTIKKLCDGFGITLGEFFSTQEFDELEQEIQ